MRNLLLKKLLLGAFLFLSLENVKSEEPKNICPTGCKCNWQSGKQTAECSGLSAIPLLGSEVQVIRINQSVIKSLPKDIFHSLGLHNLQKISLKNCKIEEIHKDAFFNLVDLMELNLSHNSITSLDMKMFESNIGLSSLDLSNNPLASIVSTPPTMFMFSMQFLDLSNCHLSIILKSVLRILPSLKTLKLAQNRFTYLSEEIFKPLTSLSSLSLDGNPWKCDCRLKRLVDWVIKINIVSQISPICAEPLKLANVTWNQLNSSSLSCHDEIVQFKINGKHIETSLVEANIGDNITMSCFIREDYSRNFNWIRHGDLLMNSSKYSLDIDLNNTSLSENVGKWMNLTINNLDSKDKGDYICSGRNDVGQTQRNLILKLKDQVGNDHGLGNLEGLGWKVVQGDSAHEVPKLTITLFYPSKSSI